MALTIPQSEMLPTGSVIQSLYTLLPTYVTTTVNIPFDDTIPLITEGLQIASISFTPKLANSKLLITVTLNVNASGGAHISSALFRDGATNAIAATYTTVYANSYGEILSFTTEENANSTNPTTFTLRMGPNGAFTMYLNGHGTRIFGGVNKSSVLIQEIKQ